MPITHTLLRYPGGKTKLFPYVADLFKENNLMDGHYVEAYAGGAGLGISLLVKGYARYIHLNDLDPSIYAFWWSLIHKNEEFIHLIEKTEVTVEEWLKQKNIQAQGDQNNFLSLGFSTFFLNRTNISGIIKGGLIGGKDQVGKYKIDARFTKSTLIKKARLIGFYKSRFTIYNQDAAKFLSDTAKDLPQNTLINLDPPYYIKGKALYQNWYSHEDHVAIADIVPSLQQYWMITYDNVDAIHDLYKKFHRINYGLQYSAHRRVIGKEVMIVDPRLILPDIRHLLVA